MKKVLATVLAVGLSLGLGFSAMSKSPAWGDDMQEMAKPQPASHKGRTAACTSCHKLGSGSKPMPANHKDRKETSCKMCHKAP